MNCSVIKEYSQHYSLSTIVDRVLYRWYSLQSNPDNNYPLNAYTGLEQYNSFYILFQSKYILASKCLYTDSMKVQCRSNKLSYYKADMNYQKIV
jgi:hypothetical protein